MLLSSSDIIGTLMYLFLFTNTAQKELVSINTQRIQNSNYLFLPYYLGYGAGRGEGVQKTHPYMYTHVVFLTKNINQNLFVFQFLILIFL